MRRGGRRACPPVLAPPDRRGAETKTSRRRTGRIVERDGVRVHRGEREPGAGQEVPGIANCAPRRHGRGGAKASADGGDTYDACIRCSACVGGRVRAPWASGDTRALMPPSRSCSAIAHEMRSSLREPLRGECPPAAPQAAERARSSSLGRCETRGERRPGSKTSPPSVGPRAARGGGPSHPPRMEQRKSPSGRRTLRAWATAPGRSFAQWRPRLLITTSKDAVGWVGCAGEAQGRRGGEALHAVSEGGMRWVVDGSWGLLAWFKGELLLVPNHERALRRGRAGGGRGAVARLAGGVELGGRGVEIGDPLEPRAAADEAAARGRGWAEAGGGGRGRKMTAGRWEEGAERRARAAEAAGHCKEGGGGAAPGDRDLGAPEHESVFKLPRAVLRRRSRRMSGPGARGSEETSSSRRRRRGEARWVLASRRSRRRSVTSPWSWSSLPAIFHAALSLCARSRRGGEERRFRIWRQLALLLGVRRWRRKAERGWFRVSPRRQHA